MNAKKWLLSLIICELVVSAVLISQRKPWIPPPAPNLSKLDPSTATAILELRQKVADGDSSDWRTLAEAFLGNGYYVAAEICFSRASDLAPDDLQLTYSRGFCLERVGRTADAIRLFRQTAAQDRGELGRTCWYQIGRCYLRQENAVHAEAAFRTVIDFSPAAYQLAKLLIRSDRADEAVPLLDLELSKMPNSLKLIQLKMRAATQLGDDVLASQLRDHEDRADYQLVLEYSQSFVTMFAGRFGLAALLSEAIELKTAGTLAQRKAVFDEALGIIRRNRLWQYRSVFVAAAHVEYGLDNFEAAEGLVSEARRFSHDGSDLIELDGLLLAAAGDVDRAVASYRRALAMTPSVGLIDAILDSGIIKEGERAQLEADKRFLSGLQSFRGNQLKQAEPDILTATKINPSKAIYWFYAGEIYRLTQAFDKAASAYSNCLKVDPCHGRAVIALKTLQRSRPTP